MPTAYGNFHDFCRDSGDRHATLPVCNLFDQALTRQGAGWGGCDLTGISLSNGNLANLGSILLCGIAIIATLFMIWRSDLKRAAVGRREMQLFLAGYILIEICEIFTVGGFPLNSRTRRAFSAVHIAAIVATVWMLLLNALIGFQVLDDGTPLSIGLVTISTVMFFVGTGYIALDTAFSWTGYWDDALTGANHHPALYTLYQLAPLVFLAIFFVLETVLVVRILGERRPMAYLFSAALLFAIGQIFQYVASVHICSGTSGNINGGLFETLFTLLAVVMIWIFWSSITEDDWPGSTSSTTGAYT